jgi:hypothetical protein
MFLFVAEHAEHAEHRKPHAILFNTEFTQGTKKKDKLDDNFSIAEHAEHAGHENSCSPVQHRTTQGPRGTSQSSLGPI